jgi:hypothetical protein
MIMYKLTKNSDGQVAGVINLETFGQIPFDPANTDYQAYLAWVAEGNTPLPAENT